MWILFILVMVFVMNQVQMPNQPVKKITYSEFHSEVEKGNVKEATFQQSASKIQGKFIDGYENGSYFELVGNTGDESYKFLVSHGIIPNYKEPEKQGLFSQMLITWFPILLVLFVFVFFLRQLQAGGGKAMSFGKSKA